jgi:flavodoxin
MKTLILYSSTHHGNTEKIAQVMAKELAADLVNIDKKPEIPDSDKYDLIGFGSGIYAFMHSMDLINLAKQMELTGKKVFIFSTSAFGKTVFHNSLKKILINKGADLVGEFSCMGWITWAFFGWFGGGHKGKPDSSDLQRAGEFARNLKI